MPVKCCKSIVQPPSLAAHGSAVSEGPSWWVEHPVGSRVPLGKAQPGSQVSITVAGSGHPASPSAGH